MIAFPFTRLVGSGKGGDFGATPNYNPFLAPNWEQGVILPLILSFYICKMGVICLTSQNSLQYSLQGWCRLVHEEWKWHWFWLIRVRSLQMLHITQGQQLKLISAWAMERGNLRLYGFRMESVDCAGRPLRKSPSKSTGDMKGHLLYDSTYTRDPE